MLNIIKDGEVVGSVRPGNSIFLDGSYVSPAEDGWSDGVYTLVAIAEEENPKLTGIDFNGTMCSATAEDQHGLAAVLVAIQFQGAGFQPTRFHFSNGNTLVVSLDNWQEFAAVWLPFRQSFFAVEAEE